MTVRAKEGFTANDAAKMATLDTKVNVIDSEIRGVHKRIDGLETKFDDVASSLSQDIHSGLAGISKSVAERSTTNWSVILTGIGVAVSIIIAIGGLVWLPISTSINDLKVAVVPRAEHEIERTAAKELHESERRAVEDDKRDMKEKMSDLQTWVRRIDTEHREDTRHEFERLQRENYDLRTDLRKAQANQKP